MPSDARNHYSASRISDIFTLQYKISDPGHIKENLKESLVRNKTNYAVKGKKAITECDFICSM